MAKGNCKRKVCLHDDYTVRSLLAWFMATAVGNWSLETGVQEDSASHNGSTVSACHAGDPGDKARSLSWEDPLERKWQLP